MAAPLDLPRTPSLRLDGRRALVTGAGRGLGLACAAALAEAGAQVTLAARTGDEVEAVAQALRARGDRAEAAVLDVTDLDAVAAFLDGGPCHDILVNNAGTNPAFGPVVDQDKGRFMKTLDVNLWAPVLWTGLAWRAWMRDHGGTVVNTASVGGLVVGPNLGVYHASKAALIHITKQLALELGPKVRVNAVAPGVVRTKLAEALWKEHEDAVSSVTPLGRIGEPADVGSAVAFLVSDAASWMTGETMVIDGGQILGSSMADGTREHAR